jgi:hypothetical protein
MLRLVESSKLRKDLKRARRRGKDLAVAVRLARPIRVWHYRRPEGHIMSKTKLTVSVSEDLATYLRSKPNASAVVAEAVEEYRVRELEERLGAAYREDASESERLHEEWEAVDAEVSE